MAMLRKVFEAIDLKVAENSELYPAGAISGYASIFGNVDLGGDVTEKGAFKKTIKEGVPVGRVKFIDSHLTYEGTKAVIGVVDQAKEDTTGLFFNAKLSSVQHAQDVRTKVKEGILDALSFGYSVIQDEVRSDGVRLLKELKLYEISVVAWGMNPKAYIAGVKGVVSTTNEMKLAPTNAEWDGVEAEKRIAALIGGSKDDWTEVEWARYSKAFLWCDQESTCKASSYHFPVADVVDGGLAYHWNGAKAALTAIRSNSYVGGLADAKGKIEAELKGLYDRFGKDFPEKGTGAEEEKGFALLLAGMNDLTLEVKRAQLLREITDYSKSIK